MARNANGKSIISLDNQDSKYFVTLIIIESINKLAVSLNKTDYEN
jgi:hypothetical protein